MNQNIDINCDVGEGLGNEADLMPYISSCSIACGAHAGDESTIEQTILLALKQNVKIGAHPSFPDKENFGRKILNITSAELQKSIESQITLVKKYTESHGSHLHHVKAHRALYNLAAKDEKTALALIAAVKNVAKNVFLYVPYGSLLVDLAKKNDLKIKIEAFADRNYNFDLSLVSRKEKDAIITNPTLVAEHLLKMITEQRLITIDGVGVKIHAETFCIHGDNPCAISILKMVSKIVQENEIKIV
jgi:UPF0271 protein